MPHIAYERKKFGTYTRGIIATINTVLQTYAQQGFDLTLRQLYYQFVARDLFPPDRRWSQANTGRWVRDPNGTPNAEPNYKWLGSIVNDGRMSGLIDWGHIVDRTRNLQSLPHWNEPSEIVEAISKQFKVDLWERQDNYCEVWVEKDALVGVLQIVCTELDVPYFSCRGYTSQSEMWGASQRLLQQVKRGKTVTIVHLGDHDPSGIDMSRDIDDRLWQFVAQDYMRFKAHELDIDLAEREELRPFADYVSDHLKVNRIALTMDQITQYTPPPNPAKVTDSRAGKYIAEHGNSSWELDALDPPVLTQLIRNAVEDLIDDATWQDDTDREDEGRRRLRALSQRWALMDKHWTEVLQYIDGLNGGPAPEPEANAEPEPEDDGDRREDYEDGEWDWGGDGDE